MNVCPAASPMALERCLPTLVRAHHLLELVLQHHPVLACAGALLLTGVGLLGAVTLVTLTAALPLTVLLGLI